MAPALSGTSVPLALYRQVPLAGNTTAATAPACCPIRAQQSNASSAQQSVAIVRPDSECPAVEAGQEPDEMASDGRVEMSAAAPT